MIGNDIVDLTDAEAQPEARHPRFDARVFTRAERALIQASAAPERLRWMLWAAKEAAYKVARKLDPGALFSPSRFAVELDLRLRGRVRGAGLDLPVEIHASRDAVHAIARDRAQGRVVCALRELAADAPEGASAAARALAVRTLAAHLGTPERALAVEREGRVPHLRGPRDLPPVDLSLSHHGRLVAFAGEIRS